MHVLMRTGQSDAAMKVQHFINHDFCMFFIYLISGYLIIEPKSSDVSNNNQLSVAINLLLFFVPCIICHHTRLHHAGVCSG